MSFMTISRKFLGSEIYLHGGGKTKTKRQP